MSSCFQHHFNIFKMSSFQRAMTIRSTNHASRTTSTSTSFGKRLTLPVLLVLLQVLLIDYVTTSFVLLSPLTTTPTTKCVNNNCVYYNSNKLLLKQEQRYVSASIIRLFETTSSSSSSNNDSVPTNDDNDTTDSESAAVAAQQQQQQQQQIRQQQQQKKRLDPLVASLTKMDDETINAPKINIPLWGELLLDRSLFIFLPVAAFAIIGIILSIVVFVNSGDSFVTALEDNTNDIVQRLSTGASSSSSSSTSIDDSTCRGLCSSQESDLNSLRIYMNSLAGK